MFTPLHFSPGILVMCAWFASIQSQGLDNEWPNYPNSQLAPSCEEVGSLQILFLSGQGSENE